MSEEILTADNGQRMGTQHVQTVLTDREEKDTRLNSKMCRSRGQPLRHGETADSPDSVLHAA